MGVHAAAAAQHNVVSMSIDCPEALQRVRGWSASKRGPALVRLGSRGASAAGGGPGEGGGSEGGGDDGSPTNIGTAANPGPQWDPLAMNHDLVHRIQSIGAVSLLCLFAVHIV